MLSREPVFRQPGYTVGVDRIHRAVFIELHQYLRIPGIDIQDILDQLIVFFFAGGLDHSDQVRLCPADLLRCREQDAALVLAVMFLGIGRIAVACIVGAFALAVSFLPQGSIADSTPTDKIIPGLSTFVYIVHTSKTYFSLY